MQFKVGIRIGKELQASGLSFEAARCTPPPPEAAPLCVKPETQTKRQASQHDYLLSLLSDGDTHCNKNPIYVFLYGHCVASVLISTFMCL